MAPTDTRAYDIAYSDLPREERRKQLDELMKGADRGLQVEIRGYYEMLAMEEEAQRGEG